jgi:hypothetical protein
MPPVSGGVEIVVLPAGEKDELEQLREPAQIEHVGAEVTVTIRPEQLPANDQPIP